MTGVGAEADYEQFRRLDVAFRTGDFETIRDEVGDIDGFPNVVPSLAIGPCLTYAVYHSPVDLVVALLDAGADANGPADDGFPPLIAALTCLTAPPGGTARQDVIELATLLLDHGADIHTRGFDDYTPLHVAASQGDLDAVDLLLARGADANAVTRIDDPETPMEAASMAGHAGVVDRLRPLTTRLDWDDAVRSGDTRTLRRLLRAGQDIDLRDGYGQTALMRAAHAGQREVVELLITESADLDHTAKYHLSALMLAVIAGHARIARILVSANADTTITGTGAPGFHGKTAADLADDRCDTKLAERIRGHVS